MFEDPRQTAGQRRAAAEVLAALFSQDLPLLVELLLHADTEQFTAVYGQLQVHGPEAVERLQQAIAERDLSNDSAAAEAANAAAALLLLRRPQQVWPLFERRADPRVTSYLIHLLGPLGVAPDLVAQRLSGPSTDGATYALLLAMGELPLDGQRAQRAALVERVADWYRRDADPGIHGAAEWVLRRWGETSRIGTIRRELADEHAPLRLDPLAAGRRWYVNSLGGTMTVVSAPGEVIIGSTEKSEVPLLPVTRHRRRIARSFAIAAHEVTAAEMRAFQEYVAEQARKEPARLVIPPKDYNKPRRSDEVATANDEPTSSVTWFETAAFCNWLTRRELGEQHVCYEEVVDSSGSVIDFRLDADTLDRLGYRLPTEAEWEYACRGGTETARYYGEADRLLDHYACHLFNSNRRAQPVGFKKPNPLGLFDILGNTLEWCMERDSLYPQQPPPPGSPPVDDRLTGLGVVDPAQDRVARGGAFYHPYVSHSAHYRQLLKPTEGWPTNGFRLARTVPSTSGAADKAGPPGRP